MSPHLTSCPLPLSSPASSYRTLSYPPTDSSPIRTRKKEVAWFQDRNGDPKASRGPRKPRLLNTAPGQPARSENNCPPTVS